MNKDNIKKCAYPQHTNLKSDALKRLAVMTAGAIQRKTHWMSKNRLSSGIGYAAAMYRLQHMRRFAELTFIKNFVKRSVSSSPHRAHSRACADQTEQRSHPIQASSFRQYVEVFSHYLTTKKTHSSIYIHTEEDQAGSTLFGNASNTPMSIHN